MISDADPPTTGAVSPLARAIERLTLAVARLDQAVGDVDGSPVAVRVSHGAPPLDRDDVSRRLDAAVDRLKAVLGE